MYNFIDDIKGFSNYVQTKLEYLYPEAIFKYSEENYFRSINRIIEELNFYGSVSLKSDKDKFFSFILSRVYDKIDSLANNYCIEYIMILLRLLEYNRYLAHNLMVWSRNKENDFISTIKQVDDPFSKNLLLFLEQNKNEKDIYRTFQHFEYALAISQGGIETVIERVYYLFATKSTPNDYRLTNIQEKHINELFNICFLFQIINSLKIQYTIGEFAKENLIVTQEGISLKKGESHRENPYLDYYNYITNKEEFTQYSVFSNTCLNNEIKKYYGLNLDEMSKLLSGCKRENLTETFVADKQGLVNFVCSNTNFSISEVKLFIDNMVFGLDRNEFIIDTPNKCCKASRKCLIDICGIFIFPYGLFRTSINNIILDFVTGDSCYADLEKKLLANMQKRNKKFEIEVYNKLLELPNAFVKNNVQNIPDDNGKFILSDQIDIILLYNNLIYVIECKDMPLKITSRKVSNAENKFKKEYSSKLKNKIKEIEVNINKRVLLRFMGDNNELFINSEVKGLIVTSEYFDPSKDIIEYPTIVWTQLIEYLKN